jgi:hypothetical protein
MREFPGKCHRYSCPNEIAGVFPERNPCLVTHIQEAVADRTLLGEQVKKLALANLVAAGLACALPASSAETVTYTYDAKGRLIRVVRTGTVNSNVTTEYTHDKANNRKSVVTTGSSNQPPPQ